MSSVSVSLHKKTREHSSGLFSPASGCFDMKHHGGKGEPQFNGRLCAIKDAGIAVPAFLRILDQRRDSFSHGSEDLRRADVRTGSTGVALLLVKNGWQFITSFIPSCLHSYTFVALRRAHSTYSSIEYLNPKQIQISNLPNCKWSLVTFWILVIAILFRISILGFSISLSSYVTSWSWEARAQVPGRSSPAQLSGKWRRLKRTFLCTLSSNQRGLSH